MTNSSNDVNDVNDVNNVNDVNDEVGKQDVQHALDVLLQPIRRRFIYHFILNDSTNSITSFSTYIPLVPFYF